MIILEPTKTPTPLVAALYLESDETEIILPSLTNRYQYHGHIDKVRYVNLKRVTRLGIVLNILEQTEPMSPFQLEIVEKWMRYQKIIKPKVLNPTIERVETEYGLRFIVDGKIWSHRSWYGRPKTT